MSRAVSKSPKTLTIAHLYPAEMNIYGDRGNVMAIIKRLEWRGIRAKLILVGVGDKFDFREADIVFGGGGQDKGQAVIAPDLNQKGANIKTAAADGVAMLVICGSYQLFGRQFTTQSGKVIPGIGLFAAETNGSTKRLIGNTVIKTDYGKIVGFENHSGLTHLDPTQRALGRVIKGYGNNESRKLEGAVHLNVFGSYLHGPLLPKNPHLTDEIIGRAMARKYGKTKLKPLDNSFAKLAAKTAAARPQ